MTLLPATIVYFRSGIGNLIQATPAMQALASMDQTGMIDVCLDSQWVMHDSRSKAATELLRACHFVRDVLELTGPADLPAGRYRQGFVPVQSETSDLGRAVLRLSPQPAWPGANWRSGLVHEAWVNMQIVRRLYGYEGPAPSKFCPTDPDVPILSGLPRPIIGVCNGAFGAEMWAKKRWPWWPELCRLLRRYWCGSVVAIGGPGELAHVPAGLLTADYTGRLSITQSARAIAQCDLFVTTDTACMHIADALGVPTIALFGPTLVSKNGPLSHMSVALRSPAECAPCQYTERFSTCHDYICMRMITPAMVMDAARRMMALYHHDLGGLEYASAG